MRWRSIALLAGGLAFLLSGQPAVARVANGGNCVAFARQLTGIHLDGNAAAWWPHAQGRYERGRQPAVGAILVFRPSGRMRVGHVAVVSRIVGPREVLVDQANWVRGRVTKAMSVVDASPANDWTSVKVLEPHSGTHGRENPTYGFIYPRVLPASFEQAVAEPDPPTRRRDGPAAHATKAQRHDEAAAAPDRRGRRISSPAAHTVRAEDHAAGNSHASGPQAAAKAHIVQSHSASPLSARSPDRPDAARAGARIAADTPSHHGHKAKPAFVVY